MKKFILLACATLFILSGCKKENTTDDDPQDQDPDNNPCLLVKTTRANFLDQLYTYDNQKRLVKYVNGTTEVTFSYSGNVITIVNKHDGELFFTKTVTLNEHGLATTVDAVPALAPPYKETYEYNGSMVTKRYYTSSNGTTTLSRTYEWENGNIVKENRSNGDIIYEYDTNKLSHPADFQNFGQFETGYRIFKSKNRIKKIKQDNGENLYTHFEDSNGNITNIKVNTPNSEFNIIHHYECD